MQLTGASVNGVATSGVAVQLPGLNLPGFRRGGNSTSLGDMGVASVPARGTDFQHAVILQQNVQRREKDSHGHHSKPKTAIDIVTSLAAGGIAGACAKTTIAPLERVKIMFQVTHTQFSIPDAFRTLKRIYRSEGFVSLWKGHGAVLVRIVPFAAIQFMSHEQYKSLLTVNGEISPVGRFIAGALAGATSTTLTYPLDLMRARLAMHKHSSLIGGIRQVHSLGFRTLYRGLGPTLGGIIPYAGTSFLTYETLQNMVKSFTGRDNVNAIERLVCGAIGGLCGQTISYPLDIVRRRMQTDEHGSQRKYYTVSQTMRMIFRNEGWQALYKGLSLNWIKGPVAVGISFTTYDIVSRRLRELNHLH